MQGKYVVADPRQADSLKQLSKAITAWDPLFSLRFSRGESLYGGILTSYGLSVGSTTLVYRGRREAVEPGDAVVMPPSVRVAAQPAADFLWVCYEGLPPAHLSGPNGIAAGFERFALASAAQESTDQGRCRRVLPTTDLRHRVHCNLVETENGVPHAGTDLVELHYVLTGQGEARVGPSPDQLGGVLVSEGALIAIGPGVWFAPCNGLVLCTWILFSEMAHRRRVRAAGVA
jgi:mannose-6-phosphate isomerase-like protein (cupin superfamily)